MYHLQKYHVLFNPGIPRKLSMLHKYYITILMIVTFPAITRTFELNKFASASTLRMCANKRCFIAQEIKKT